MRDLFYFKNPEIEGLQRAELLEVVKFCEHGFGTSEWVTKSGDERSYYFDMERAYASGSDAEIVAFHNLVAQFIRNVATLPEIYTGTSKSVESPVLAFLCSDQGTPAGVIQMRGVLAERLGWESVSVYPDRKLLRARVVAKAGVNFPANISWLAGRGCVVFADAVTTGTSIAGAVGALRAFGARPYVAITVYDRDEGGREALEAIGIPFYSLFGKKEYLDVGVNENLKTRMLKNAPEIKPMGLAGVAARAA